MRILGIDYGRSKIGLALGVDRFAEPLKVIQVSSFEDAVQKIKKEMDKEKPDKVIVGISEGAMGEESKKFAMGLGAGTFDETLTSKDAQTLSIQAGVRQHKRHQMEDAYAASIMLQNYLDSFKP
jgi:putative transcription antitermination factor YqgF